MAASSAIRSSSGIALVLMMVTCADAFSTGGDFCFAKSSLGRQVRKVPFACRVGVTDGWPSHLPRSFSHWLQWMQATCGAVVMKLRGEGDAGEW